MAEEENSWQEFFENNRLILPHPSRRITDGQKQAITGFCLTVKSVQGARLQQTLTNVRSSTSFVDIFSEFVFILTWLFLVQSNITTPEVVHFLGEIILH
jgi:uncharacterized membrane protein